MKKLLALGPCLCAAFVLTMGSTGCTTKKDGAAKDAAAKDKDKDNKIVIGLLSDERTRRPDEVPFTLEISFQLNRGKAVNKEVALTVAVEPPDKGVTASVKLGGLEISGFKTDASLQVTVGADTKEGTYVVTVTAKAEGSPDAEAKTVINIKKDMNLVVHRAKTSEKDIPNRAPTLTVMQGGKKDAKVPVTLGKDLKGVRVTAEVKADKGETKGVTVAVAPAKLDASGDATATITVADDAPAGTYTVTITAAGEGAMPSSQSSEIALTVEKKKGS